MNSIRKGCMIKGHNSDNNRWILSLIELDLYFYDYTPVYEIWIQYTNVFKRYRLETIVLDVLTDKGDTICPPPHPHPI